MGHRQLLNTLQILEAEARAGFSGGSSLAHPVKNMNIQGGSVPSTAPRSSRRSSSILNSEFTGQSHDLFTHQLAHGNLHNGPDNYLHHPSSSSLSGQTVPRVGSGSNNQTMVRGPHKRKSMHYDVGSSSNMQLPAGSRLENQITELHHTPSEYLPGLRVNSLSISGAGMSRNVRSRTGVDPQPNVARAYSSSNSMNLSDSGRSSGQPNPVDFARGSSNTYSGFLSHDPNSLNALNSRANGSVVSGVYTNNATSNRNPVPQNANCNANQSIRGVQSGYDQRLVSARRASSSNSLQLAASNEGQQMAAGSYNSRNRRVSSSVRLHQCERNARNGDIYRSFTEQGLMAANNAALFGSTRNPLDQHMDMRLDVDNMSYEELLVLGERIGTVSTGLSDNLISKCLIESIYCASDECENDERCSICLEEYKHMDDVGNLKCGHDFHVSCVRKWLSMKNLCPICKASAMDESKTKE